MTKIDFYILADGTEASRETLACRLTDKAFRRGHRICVHTGELESCLRISDLLWQIRPDAFLPHTHPYEQAPEQEGQSQILLNHLGNPSEEHHDVLINLSTSVPAFFSRFERVIEVVCQHEQVLATTRDNWKFYQHRGYPLQSHRL